MKRSMTFLVGIIAWVSVIGAGAGATVELRSIDDEGRTS
jgi:hypothetical protein